MLVYCKQYFIAMLVKWLFLVCFSRLNSSEEQRSGKSRHLLDRPEKITHVANSAELGEKKLSRCNGVTRLNAIDSIQPLVAATDDPAFWC